MSEPKNSQRRRGRPALPPEQRRRHNMTFRIRGDLRSRLQAAADTAGRSLSEEVECRVEASLDRGLAVRTLLADLSRFLDAEHRPQLQDDQAHVGEAEVQAAVDARLRAGGRDR